MYVTYNGLAMPCCMVSTADRINFGSVQGRGLERVWNGPQYEEFRGQLGSDDPPAVCRSCSVYRGTF
jgi:radical SAM protein with 4Fe4S-binding SPASM domain